ncbi:M48 family metallopeptidase [Mastigocoleus sp. MO_188.B34]|uniref:M48 family metallopeptidase n=1 Tax=Mastigocoleus sp. MO_188.B34 TaxID=3036635 RepID=UPI00261480C5|nr:M48 family metallopeptidase [Mastigocoleus sp. MO_188.B34]MDJ0695005.1 M48 family metallopeptidase [Mastigocoleus sp. MO_188.B34]
MFPKHFFKRWFYPLISVFIAVIIFLSAPLPSQATPLWRVLLEGAQVIQLSNVSDRQEVKIGKQINQQLGRRGIKFYRNRRVNRYVNRIGQRLAAQSDRPNIPYKFQVVEDKNINAFATAGGYVYVHTGLLEAADNEAELASVIAHEIGHIGGRHLVKQLRQTTLASGVATALGVRREKLVSLGVELALKRPNSRRHEYDADKRGLRTLNGAGYDPSGMVTFMQKLLNKRSVPTLFSTHPATSSRIRALKAQIENLSSKGNDGLSPASYKANIRPLS